MCVCVCVCARERVGVGLNKNYSFIGWGLVWGRGSGGGGCVCTCKNGYCSLGDYGIINTEVLFVQINNYVNVLFCFLSDCLYSAVSLTRARE